MTNTPFPLELQNISCAFGEGPRHVSALNNVSLAVNPGELVAIMGPSGSGKSTLLNVAGLLQRATSGHVLIDGASASDLNAKRAAETRRRHIGVIFQNYNLVPTLTVGENVGLPLELDGKTDRQAVAIALAEVGLEGFDDRFPKRSPAAKPSASPSREPSSAPENLACRRTHRRPRHLHRRRSPPRPPPKNRFRCRRPPCHPRTPLRRVGRPNNHA